MPMATPEAQREYQRQWVARRRAEFFADKACVKCGSTTDMRLDHIDPQAKVSHKIWSWSTARREAEIAKCQVLCEKCHKDKNLTDMIGTHGHVHQHGTLSMYRRHKCKCVPCTAANTESQRQKRAAGIVP